MIWSSNKRPLAFHRDRLLVSGTARHATTFKFLSPRRGTKRQQQPSGYIARLQKKSTALILLWRRPTNERVEMGARRLTPPGFDRSRSPLLPRLKSSIMDRVCPLESRGRRLAPAAERSGIDFGGVQTWAEDTSAATRRSSHFAPCPGQIAHSERHRRVRDAPCRRPPKPWITILLWLNF